MVERIYKSVYLNCVYEEGWKAEHARILYQQLKELADEIVEMENPPFLSIFDEAIGRPLPETENQNWCGGDGKMLAMDWQGDFYPCLRYMGSSLGGEQEPYVIGDLEHGIMGTEEQKRRVEVLAGISRKSQSSEECFRCKIASGCSWCSAYNYQKTGTPNRRVTYICQMHQARVMANCYYWNRMREKTGQGNGFRLNIPAEWAEKIIGADEYKQLLEMSEEGCKWHTSTPGDSRS